MLRTILFVIVLLIVIVIALVAFDVISLRQNDDGMAIETRDVEVGTTVRNVQLPVVRMEDRQVEMPRVGVEDEAEPAPAPAPAPAQ